MGLKRRANTEEVFEKIRVDLPDPDSGGETLWATKLGPDLYEVRNIPFTVYNLNRRDQVVAIAWREDLEPVVQRVVKRSGHKTLRVRFTDKGFGDRFVVIEGLAERGCTFEGMTPSYIAVDVPPEGDLDDVIGRLGALQEQGLLEYENCETSAPDRFDAAENE